MWSTVTAEDRRIYKDRARLVCGVEGGMPLNMTLPAMCFTRAQLLSIPKHRVSVVTLGMCDALMPALFSLNDNVRHVGGIELINYSSGHPQACATAMFNGRDVQTSLVWGQDIMALSTLVGTLTPTQWEDGTMVDVVAYAMDTSIIIPARAHWYRLLEADSRVCAVATAYHASFDLNRALPSFQVIHSYRVNLEGGNCSRRMIILRRRLYPLNAL